MQSSRSEHLSERSDSQTYNKERIKEAELIPFVCLLRQATGIWRKKGQGWGEEGGISGSLLK